MVIIGGEFTMIELVAVLPPFWVVTVTVAGPGETPVTRPVWLTDTEEELEDHDTNLFVAPTGDTVAVSCCVPPTSMVLDVGDTLTPVTGTRAPEYTVTAQVAVKDPSVVVTTIFTVPGPTAVTSPPVLTLAMEPVKGDQETAEFVAFVGDRVAVSWSVEPVAKKAVL
jgi:CxxC motif-containing protein